MSIIKQRWIFRKEELDNPERCRSDDLFITSVPSSEVGIYIKRNGKATNEWGDGTVGVPQEVQEEAEDTETYYDSDTNDYADVWKDVWADEVTGVFCGFVEEKYSISYTLVVHINHDTSNIVDPRDAIKLEVSSVHDGVKIEGWKLSEII